MRKYILFFFSLLLIGFSSCDEGRIEEKRHTISSEGRVLKLTGNISGITNWPTGYNVAVAGFADNSDTRVVAQYLPINLEDGERIELVLSGISSNVTSLRLCVLSRLSEDLVDFEVVEEADFPSEKDTIFMNVGDLDVGIYSAIQTKVFDEKCNRCHGDNGSAAGGLFLTADRSYASLVNQLSISPDGMLLVKPGEVENSFLHYVLNRNGDTSMTHMDLFGADEQSLLKLIDLWIENGAQE